MRTWFRSSRRGCSPSAGRPPTVEMCHSLRIRQLPAQRHPSGRPRTPGEWNTRPPTTGLPELWLRVRRFTQALGSWRNDRREIRPQLATLPGRSGRRSGHRCPSAALTRVIHELGCLSEGKSLSCGAEMFISSRCVYLQPIAGRVSELLRASRSGMVRCSGPTAPTVIARERENPGPGGHRSAAGRRARAPGPGREGSPGTPGERPGASTGETQAGRRRTPRKGADGGAHGC